MGATTTAERAVARQRRSGARRLNRRALAGYAFVAPALILLVIFALGPFLFTVWVSLHDWNMLTPIAEMPYRGLGNYRYLLNEDPLFRETFGNTVYFTLGNVAISVILALSVALILNGPVKLRPFWRAAFFMPYVTAPVAIAIVWRNMMDADFGMINGLLDQLGLPEQPFLESLSQAMPALIGVAIWHTVGYYMIIFLAGLQAIPYDLYEAAKLDGASAWRLFWSITLPLLKPTLLFVIVVNTLASLQVFDLPFVLTDGGPVNQTNTIVMYMYDTAFRFLRMGRATSMAVMLFAVILVVTLIQLRLLREKE